MRKGHAMTLTDFDCGPKKSQQKIHFWNSNYSMRSCRFTARSRNETPSTSTRSGSASFANNSLGTSPQCMDAVFAIANNDH